MTFRVDSGDSFQTLPRYPWTAGGARVSYGVDGSAEGRTLALRTAFPSALWLRLCSCVLPLLLILPMLVQNSALKYGFIGLAIGLMPVVRNGSKVYFSVVGGPRGKARERSGRGR